jgi:hypothetical protein
MRDRVGRPQKYEYTNEFEKKLFYRDYMREYMKHYYRMRKYYSKLGDGETATVCISTKTRKDITLEF